MQTQVKWNGKLGFVGITGSNHAVVMDVSKENGGDGAAASPMEMVLLGLAGCSGIDVALIVEKKRLNVRDFEIFIKAERADEHPQVFNKVDMTFSFEGDGLSRKGLEDAVRLSLDKYCSVAGMVNKTAEINWTVEIKE
ncbi:MAG: OsmC family protein [Limnochordia bacterium]|nr:OsmC family protein [Limnochordia bacterium]